MATSKTIHLGIEMIKELPKDLSKSVQILYVGTKTLSNVLGVIHKIFPIPIPLQLSFKELYFDVNADIYGFKLSTFVIVRKKEEE